MYAYICTSCIHMLMANQKSTSITNIKNEGEDVTFNLLVIKRIIKECSQQLHVHKSDNLDEMNQFLERHKLPKFT